MLKPTIHLNGSSLADLCESNDRARAALRQALNALEETAPHERDYYPQGPAAGIQARKEFRERHEKVQSVLRELDEIRIYLDDEVQKVANQVREIAKQRTDK